MCELSVYTINIQSSFNSMYLQNCFMKIPCHSLKTNTVGFTKAFTSPRPLLIKRFRFIVFLLLVLYAYYFSSANSVARA